MFGYLKQRFFGTQEKENTECKANQEQTSMTLSDEIPQSSDQETQLSSTIMLVEESDVDFDNEPYVPKSYLLRNKPVPTKILFSDSSDDEDDDNKIKIIHGYLTLDKKIQNKTNSNNSDNITNISTTNITTTNNVSKLDKTMNQTSYISDNDKTCDIPIPIIPGYIEFPEKKKYDFDKTQYSFYDYRSEVPSHSILLNKSEIKKKKDPSVLSKIMLSPNNSFNDTPKKSTTCPDSSAKSVKFGPQKPPTDEETSSSSIPRKTILKKQSSTNSKANSPNFSSTKNTDSNELIKSSNHQNIKTSFKSPKSEYSFNENNISFINDVTPIIVKHKPNRNQLQISTISNSNERKQQNQESKIAQSNFISTNSPKSSKTEHILKQKRENTLLDSSQDEPKKRKESNPNKNISILKNNTSELKLDNDDIVINKNKFMEFDSNSDDEPVQIAHFPNLKLNNSKVSFINDKTGGEAIQNKKKIISRFKK